MIIERAYHFIKDFYDIVKIEKDSNKFSLLKRSFSEQMCTNNRNGIFIASISKVERRFTRVENVYFSPSFRKDCEKRKKRFSSLFKTDKLILLFSGEVITHT